MLLQPCGASVLLCCYCGVLLEETAPTALALLYNPTLLIYTVIPTVSHHTLLCALLYSTNCLYLHSKCPRRCNVSKPGDFPRSASQNGNGVNKRSLPLKRFFKDSSMDKVFECIAFVCIDTGILYFRGTTSIIKNYKYPFTNTTTNEFRL